MRISTQMFGSVWDLGGLTVYLASRRRISALAALLRLGGHSGNNFSSLPTLNSPLFHISTLPRMVRCEAVEAISILRATFCQLKATSRRRVFTLDHDSTTTHAYISEDRRPPCLSPQSLLQLTNSAA